MSNSLQPYGLLTHQAPLFMGFFQARILATAAAAKSLQSCPTLCDPQRRQPTRLPRSWKSPGKNTGVGCYFLLQGIFLTQGSSPCLLQLLLGRQILYHCVTWEASNKCLREECMNSLDAQKE